MTTTQPCRSAYVHVPFCLRRCGYCDFYSQVLDPAAAGPYVSAVLAELDRWIDRRPARFDTIYVGGGTPTVLPAAELRRLLAALSQQAASDSELEFTVEANPATVSEEIAATLAGNGVNRVSLGAQSFDRGELRTLDRAHTPEQVVSTVETCRAAGIERLSLDLIFGIPGQTRASWVASLDAAVELGVEHLSCYGLTCELGTPLRARLDAGLLERMDHDLEAELYELAMDRLPAAGLGQYEISNFARPGGESRHNLRCWHNEPYLGLGPSAAGYVDGVRYTNVSDTAAYVSAVSAGRSPWHEHERLPPERRAREAAMLALRLNVGIDLVEFERRRGFDPRVLFADAIQRHAADGLLAADDAGIRLTRAGRLLADTVVVDFL